jgi:hypothetical protein
LPVLEITRLVLIIAHLIGLAAIIGAFIQQMPRRTGFEFAPMFVGSIVQLVTGVALIAVDKGQGLAIIDAKMVVKISVTLVILATVIVGIVRQRRLVGAGGSDKPVLWFLRTAGILAIANVVVAVVWH